MAARADFGITEFAYRTILHRAAQLRGHRLHAIANAQHRHTQIEYCLRRARRITFRHRIWATRKYDASRFEIADEFISHVARMQLAVHMGFTHTARDELAVLGTEIEDEDFFVGHDIL